MPSTVLTMASLGGRVQRGLDAGYRSMGACRRQALFSIAVASTAEGSNKISALIDPKDGTAKEGGGRFYSMCMWCTLRVCLTGWCFRLAGGRLGEATDFFGVCDPRSGHIINLVVGRQFCEEGDFGLIYVFIL